MLTSIKTVRMFLIIVVLQISVTCLAQEQLPFPLTTHTVEATSADFPANMPDEAKKRMIGKWELTFTKEGRFNLTKEKTVYVDGHYVTTPTHLVFTDETGMMSCKDGMATGIYKWILQDKKLLLTAIDDPCKTRMFFLTSLLGSKNKKTN